MRVASGTLFTTRMADRTADVWDPDNRLRQLLLPGGERQTMSYRSDGLRTPFRMTSGTSEWCGSARKAPITDAATGAVTDRFVWDSWGVPVKRTGTSPNCNWYIGDSG